MTARRERSWRSALTVGLLLTLGQLGLVFESAPRAPGESLPSTWDRLCTWDCAWYTAIARDGYRSTVPPVRQSKSEANVAFFPLYPWLGRALFLGAGIEPRRGLLIVAQVFAVVFWAALWRWTGRWRIPVPLAAVLILVVFAHPAAFFLVSGYSESVFLCSLLLYLLAAGGRLPRLAAAGPGMMMSAARLVGVPAAAYPVFAQLVHLMPGSGRFRVTAAGRGLGICLLSCAGAGLFFVYCKVRFGRFDLYFETQRIGWGVVADTSALWDWRGWRFSYPVDRVATLASVGAFGLFAMIEAVFAWRTGGDSGWRKRAPVYGAALVIFGITLCGLKSVQFRSMIRYSLAWYLLLTVCLVDIVARLRGGSPRMRFVSALGTLILLGGALASLAWVQVPHLREFLRGVWFA